MRPADRKALATRTFVALWAISLGLFAIMAIVSAVTGDELSTLWLPPFGCLLIMVGLHFIYFRHEDAEVFREKHEQLGLSGDFYTPGTTAVGGIAIIIMGMVFLTPGIQWLFGGR